MQELFTFYANQIEQHTTLLSKIKERLFTSSMLRLAIFCIAVAAVYFAFGNARLVVGIILATIMIFLFLVSRHSDLQYKSDKLNALIKLNKTEVEVLNRKFNGLPEGNEFKDPLHHFSQDIDLFGKGSFYQYSNRTCLAQGTEVLAHILTENSIAQIKQKQEAIKELSKMPEWRQEYSAVAGLVKTETSYKTILKWLANYKSFVPEIMKHLPNVFSVFSAILITVYFLGFVSGWIVTGWFFVGLGITGRFLKKINKLSSDTAKIQSTFHQYQKLILEIEKTSLSSELLKEKRATVVSKKVKTSKILKEFARILGALDQRNNMLMGLVGNAFLLWDLRQSYSIEKWIERYGLHVEQWFATIAFFDAYNSLGNFTFNHPTYTFPKINNNKTVLKSEGASHPLLDSMKSVPNDVEIDEEQFFIVTGANMAGKSTFLRTISLQIVMANIGLPVCAKKAEYSPIKLITSMRTTDSLTDDESYFYSELKRLKFIVDEIKTERYFIVLDEILKGTNSIDKAKGSRRFVKRLVASNSTGIIATHDLSLCDIAKELKPVKNYYFDAEIVNGELHFDYKFKEGICQNMNASFLLKKMEII
ncbi:DNA mismatch repair ATPase MutS [Saonia flava]|uniref:DNA mismatch repair ATPase MutS n=1 Tax=Saonia flava TaxID=523696 RepID=A0A846QVU3_9FLAO|nr:DNA mismatch repair protein MutS [Saonia flava]NJB71050.1 DNA mismatch repair ATPase MutS [Saonia flava]